MARDQDAGDRARIPADELAALLAVSAGLVQSLDLSSVLQTAIEGAVSVLGLDTGAVYLLDGTDLYLGATTPPLPADFPDEYRHASLEDHPHIGRCIAERQAVFVPDTANEEFTAAERGVSEARSLRSILYIPLVTDAGTVGTLIVGSSGARRPFAAHDTDLCRTLAYQIALAITNARLYASLQESNAELSGHRDHLEELVERRTHELASANVALEEATRAKSLFLANISHEFRTPLNAVIGFADILRQGLAGPLTDEQRLQVGMIAESGQRLLSLIDDLLDLSTIEAGRVPIELREFDAVALTNEIALSMMPLALDKALSLQVATDVPSCLVHSDPRRVAQILVNLVGNALKFTDTGGVVVRVSCAEPGTVALSVTDTGRGIAPEDLGRVFEAFTQAYDAAEGKAEGTGLGLALSRQYAELLGGTLEVQSARGAGSTFTLTLPLAPAG